MISLRQLTDGTPYAGYAYSYPHKTAYRPLRPAVALRDAWAAEDKSALFLYLHVPFCEMRCGFCNLFTTANPRAELTGRYLDALARQATRAREALGDAAFARMAIGGGTPTFLDAREIEALFDLAATRFGIDPRRVPTSVETSPRTADADKLRVLRERGVSRVSIGVQSFVEPEVNASGRAQKNAWVDAAIGRIRDAQFPTLNVDLIYGLPGQTVQTWLASLHAALRWRPEELYLYPLYVRPLTGLERRGVDAPDDLRLACYRAGREMLLAAGYVQRSMRMFRRADAPEADGPLYCCQDDGMLGLGAGARSYTRALHYSFEYAVGAPGVKEIIADYVDRPADAFDVIDYGCKLNDEEQRRRHAIKSLLQSDGLDLQAYRDRFASEAADDLPELGDLVESGLMESTGTHVRPTAAGLERSDAIGPWLYSNAAHERMAAYALR